jgi:hypothetical protein
MKIREQQLRRLIKQELFIINENNKFRRKLRDLTDLVGKTKTKAWDGRNDRNLDYDGQKFLLGSQAKIVKRYREWDNGRKEWQENGKIVDEEGPFERGTFKNQPPAKEYILFANGEEAWLEYGELSRKDGPARITLYDKNGRPNNRKEEWFIDGKLHRDGDKPAFITRDIKTYYKHGKRHRDGGKPAIVNTKGGRTQYWYFVDGKEVWPE